MWTALFLGGVFLALIVFGQRSTVEQYSFLPIASGLFQVDEQSVGRSYYRSYAVVKIFRRISERPIFGYGYGTYGSPSSFRKKSELLVEDGFAEVFGKVKQLDTLPPVVLAEGGGFGFAIWCVTLWWLMKDWSRGQKIGAIAGAGLPWFAVLLAATFFGPGITHPTVCVVTVLVASVVVERKYLPLKKRVAMFDSEGEKGVGARYLLEGSRKSSG